MLYPRSFYNFTLKTTKSVPTIINIYIYIERDRYIHCSITWTSVLHTCEIKITSLKRLRYFQMPEIPSISVGLSVSFSMKSGLVTLIRGLAKMLLTKDKILDT
jgi:hypothetical protein